MLNIKQHKKEIIIMTLLLLIQVGRCFNGHGCNDEHFYATLGYRFASGDNIFVDDYHIAQLIGFILVPIIKLYLTIFKSSDAIVLYIRLCYVLLSLITSLMIYIKFNEKSKYASLASILYFMFVPFNIMSLSYNTMSINFLMQAILLFNNTKKRKI